MPVELQDNIDLLDIHGIVRSFAQALHSFINVKLFEVYHS